MSVVGMTFLVMGIYLAILVCIGYLGYKRTAPTAEDYFLANRGLGTFLLVLTFIATYASLWTFLGAVGGNYRLGITFISMMMCWNVLWPLMFWVFGPRVWALGMKQKYLTYSEFIADYYSSKGLGFAAAIIGVFAMIPYIAIQVMGGGIAISTFTGGAISYQLGCSLMFLVLVVYVFIGGLKSVVWTDALQGIFFLVAMIFLASVGLARVGGVGNLFHTLAESQPELLLPGGMGSGIWLGWIFTWGFAIMIPHMFQRMLVAKSPQVLGKSATILSVVSGFVQTIPVFLLGIICVVLIPGLTGKATDSVTIAFASQFLSTPVGAIIVAGAFAAGMSTYDSQLLSASSLVTRDMVVNFAGKKLSPRSEMWLGRWAVLGLGIIVYFFALGRVGLLAVISTAATAICVSAYIFPLVGATFWPRAGKLAAWGSIIGAAIAAVVTWRVIEYPLGIYNLIWGIIVGGILFLVLTYVGTPASYEKQVKFHGLIDRVICGSKGKSGL